MMIGVLAVCTTATSMGPGGPGATRQTRLGDDCTHSNRMTLYTHDKDTLGVSNCPGLCAEFLPPVIAAHTAKSAGEFTAIIHDDGIEQWAYNGKPL